MSMLTRIIPASLILCFSMQAHAQWNTVKPLKIARQEMQGAKYGGEIFVAGGISLLGITISDLEIYDINEDKWTTGATMPQPRHHHALVQWGGKIYVIGGYKDVLFNPRSEMYIYDIPTDSWSSGPSLPLAVGAGDAVAVDGKIFFIGGTDGNNALKSVFIYDIGAGTWTQGADMPTEREHLAVEAIDGKIYAVAGRGSQFASNRLEIYDIATNSWDAGSDLPTPRSGCDAAVVNGKLYVMGGEGGGIHAENEVYDPLTDSWESLPGLPSPRHGLATVASGDSIFALAGATLEGYGPSKVNELFLTAPVTSVPKNVSGMEFSAGYDRATNSLKCLVAIKENIEGAFFSLISLDGKVIMDKKMNLRTGENAFIVDLPELGEGIYIASISMGIDHISHSIYILKP